MSQSTLPKFEHMLSHNVFLKNNKHLRDIEVLPEWVDWIQLGKPTVSQLKHHPRTITNFRLQTNDGKFLTCGNISTTVQDNVPEIKSWGYDYMCKINERINSKLVIVNVASATRDILTEIYNLIHSVVIMDTEPTLDDIIDSELSLQSHFWKIESGEYPPDMGTTLYTKQEIADEFAR